MSDVGSPIDFLVRDKIADASTTERSAACSIIELGSSQYWLFLKDTIYVLSYFPSAKITAWSTFLPTYQTSSYSGIAVFNDVGEDIVVRFGMTTDVNHAGSEVAIVDGATSLANPCSVYLFLLSESGGSVVGTYTISGGLSFSGLITLSGGPVTATYTPNQTAFVPQKFVNYNGLVIARASDGYYVYGGATGETYDNTICAWETSWLDSDSPANDKQIHGMDVAQEGTWNYYGSVDYLGGLLQRVLDGQTAATFDGGKIDWSAAGTHMKMRGQTTGLAARSVVSNLLFHYKGTKIK
jgi:hypothetical protein